MNHERSRVCPVELSGSLDNTVRRWLQNPMNIVAPFVKEGMTVLDVGCGPGFFSVELAKLVGAAGKVVAADLQEGMLRQIANKIVGSELERRITCVKCDQNSLNVSDNVDFILAFYMVHEVPDKDSFFRQLTMLLNKDGQILLVEPKLFHVSRTEFEQTIRIAETYGLRAYPGPRVSFSWSALLRTA